jgi:hypothetical protein
MAFGALAPPIEAAIYTERPPGETWKVFLDTFRQEGQKQIPLGRSVHDTWQTPETVGFVEKLGAFFNLKDEDMQKVYLRANVLSDEMWGGEGGMSDRGASRYYTNEYLWRAIVDRDLDIAHFYDMTHTDARITAAVRGLETSRANIGEALKRRGEQQDVRALSNLEVSKDTYHAAAWAIESALQRYIDTGGQDQRAKYFFKEGMPRALYAFKRAENKALRNKDYDLASEYKAGQVHMEARLNAAKKAGLLDFDIKRLPPPSYEYDVPPSFDPFKWFDREVKRLGDGNNKQLRDQLFKRADALMPEHQRAAYAYVNAFFRAGDGIDGYRNNAIFPPNKADIEVTLPRQREPVNRR